MTRTLRSSRILAPLAALCLLLATAEAGATPTQVRLAREQGNYGVGTVQLTTNTMVGGRVTKIRVFYPTDVACDAPTSYTIHFAPLPILPPGGTSGPITFSSPLCAVGADNAVDGVLVAPPAAGPFPLFIYDHGGAGLGQEFQLLTQLPLHERLASHGFVVAIATHPAGPSVTKVTDLRNVVSFLLGPGNPLHDTIDPARVGLGGTSAGGGAALGVAGSLTATPDVPPDPRIKALVLHEPAPSGVALANVAVPYLLMNGTQGDPTFYRAILDATPAASPRIHVESRDAVHLSYVTNLCSSVAEARDQALAVLGPSPDPLETYLTGSAPAEYAWLYWNFSDTLAGGMGVGGGRNICTAEDLDPWFVPTEPLVPQKPPAAERMVPVVNHYSIAFLKVFLEGDARYLSVLEPGHAKYVGPADVTILD
jgi:predicted dienelactone hydrolase